ncbi:hypothetical protein GCM10027277_46080 [Pseudoduganella ginsengisoli]|uniref:Uncharacterized protein n=1 Tax=Pseudoduganella ginsengisoli TaxID=1462440 RepID=A0A6L6Q8D6_9BURK|nr:hypothetical protein [Pseudoduganella ginsengisoli]MTW05709.1 hypothetical protein [Pseudoduganella ginsengisoli]
MKHVLLAIGFVTAMAPAIAQERTGDPLGGLAHCFDNSEFRVTSSARLPAAKQFREVQTRDGAARISTVDGYRLMLHKDSKAPLVNLKVEKSADGQFQQDRDAVLAYMELFSDSRSEGANPLEVTRQDGVEVMALNQPGIDGGGPLSFYSFAHQASGVIGTAYILAQPAAMREFHTYAEYASLRDRFVGKLVSCMAQQPLPPRG